MTVQTQICITINLREIHENVKKAFITLDPSFYPFNPMHS